MNMRKWNIFTRLRELYKEHREKQLIADFIKRKKHIKIYKILKKNHNKPTFYRMLFDTLINGIGKKYLQKYIYPQITEEEKNEDNNQKNILHDLLIEIQGTKIGKEYDIKKIVKDTSNIYQVFSDTIPVYEYHDFKKYITEAKTKENIIWPGKIEKFSASSGTTDNKKHIPVTNESLESASKAGIEMFAEYVIKHPNTKIFKGSFFPLTGSIQENENDIIIADVSALLLLNRGEMSQTKYALDVFYLLHPEREIKREIALKHINPYKPMTMIGVSSRAYEILHYIQKRDAEMFSILIKNMEVVIGGGVDVSPYMHYFKSLGINYMGAYNASEGCFGYQDIINYDNSDGKAPYKLLTNHGVFYECIAFNSENFDEQGNCRPKAKAKPIREIGKDDIGKKYALVITTNSGLIRYLMGDVLQFVDERKRFLITGRTRQSLNLKGEEVMETHIARVIDELAKETGIHIMYFTIGPDTQDNPSRHEWVIETAEEHTLSNEELAKKIDKMLQKINADYESKRKNDILLQIPKITQVVPGNFYLRLKKSNRLGGQVKVPKLSSTRKYIDEILKIAV